MPLVRAIKPDKVDSVNYPVLFTDLASQINGLFRDQKITPDEWRVLNAAWMANPAMTHMRDIEILTAFERNVPPTAIPVYLKLLTRIASTPYREPTVVEWVGGRLAELGNAPRVASTNFTYENLNALRTRLSTRGSRRELQGREIAALRDWLEAARNTPRSGEEIIRKMIQDIMLPSAPLSQGLAKMLLEMSEDASLDNSLKAIIQENIDAIREASSL